LRAIIEDPTNGAKRKWESNAEKLKKLYKSDPHTFSKDSADMMLRMLSISN
jgi:hypothetical protein